VAETQTQPATIPATVTLTCAVDKQTLFYLFSTALEGGIGYWSVCTKYHWSLPDGEDDVEGFYADVEETETDEDDAPTHRIDAQTIVRGLLYFAQPGEGYKHVRQVARAVLMGDDDLDYDALDADCIVQAGLFGEVVYG
jgi:hypothetical protein